MQHPEPVITRHGVALSPVPTPSRQDPFYRRNKETYVRALSEGRPYLDVKEYDCVAILFGLQVRHMTADFNASPEHGPWSEVHRSQFFRGRFKGVIELCTSINGRTQFFFEGSVPQAAWQNTLARCPHLMQSTAPPQQHGPTGPWQIDPAAFAAHMQTLRVLGKRPGWHPTLMDPEFDPQQGAAYNPRRYWEAPMPLLPPAVLHGSTTVLGHLSAEDQLLVCIADAQNWSIRAGCQRLRARTLLDVVLRGGDVEAIRGLCRLELGGFGIATWPAHTDAELLGAVVDQLVRRMRLEVARRLRMPCWNDLLDTAMLRACKDARSIGAQPASRPVD